jgi:UDP-N-acetylmuramoylalanine--D-glutamate ligase
MGFVLSSRVLVVGLGRSGLAAARLAAQDGAEVWVTDRRGAAELGEAAQRLPPETRLWDGGHPTEALDGVGLVIVSPGVPADAPLLEEVRRRRIALVPEIEFAWLHRPETPLVAVTGSNGKSTVTSLVAAMLGTAGIASVAGGNLGTAASDLVLAGGWDAWVLEVSSFQAELCTSLRARVGIFLNLSQDHLERHPTLTAYLAAKQRLFAFQRPEDAAVVNADDPLVAATPVRGARLAFSLERPSDAWLDGATLVLHDHPICDVTEVAMSGRHNLANALAAALAAERLGVDHGTMARTLASFAGLAHRHRTVAEAAGVRWVDDSKATNVGATLAGLAGYPGRSVHLIVGGQGKGQDFAALGDEVARSVARLYLIGVDGPDIGRVLQNAAPTEDCVTLDEAVRRAARRASAGETVLLAPACASFDQFSNYAERGDRFARLVLEEVATCP